jgi:hypothetical protein
MRRATLVLILIAFAVPSYAARIELHNPLYPLSYCLVIAPDEPSRFEVLLHSEGATNIVGTRFRISGLPAGCGVTAVLSPEVVSMVGDVFSAGGAEIVCGARQPGSPVKLLDVTVTCPVASMSQYITLQPAANQPASPGLDCPQVIKTTPELVYECADAAAISNHPLSCEIAVTPTSWTVAKSLYR